MTDKERIKELEDKISCYEKDPIKRGYFSLARIVNQQVDILNSFNLSTEISQNPKEDKKYDRVKSIWEGLKEMIVDLKNLRIELKVGEQEAEDDTPFIESVAQPRR